MKIDHLIDGKTYFRVSTIDRPSLQGEMKYLLIDDLNRYYFEQGENVYQFLKEGFYDEFFETYEEAYNYYRIKTREYCENLIKKATNILIELDSTSVDCR